MKLGMRVPTEGYIIRMHGYTAYCSSIYIYRNAGMRVWKCKEGPVERVCTMRMTPRVFTNMGQGEVGGVSSIDV